jgi:hypothetical protein
MIDLNFQKGTGPANRQLDFGLTDLEFVEDDDESVLGMISPGHQFPFP